MIKKILSSALILSVLMQCPVRLTPSAHAALSELDKSIVGARNLLVNPAADASTAGWSSTGGVLTTTTIGGTHAFVLTSSGAGQKFFSGYKTISTGDELSGQNGAVSCLFKAASGTATHKIYAFDGTNPIGDVTTVTSSTDKFTRATANFIFPSSGTVRLEVATVSGSEPVLYQTRCYFGQAEGFNLTSSTGGVLTSWVPSTHVTVVNMGAITDNQLMERRNGNNLEISGTVQLGSGAGGDATLLLSGITIDPIKAGTGPGNKLGDIYMSASSQLQHYGAGVPQGVIFYDGSTTDRLFMATKTYTDNSRIFDKTDGSGIKPSTNSKATINFTVPIQGWSAQVNGLNYLADPAAKNQVRVSGSTSNGTAGYRVRVFPNVIDNIGTAIQYIPDSTNGDSFKILESGYYGISHTGNANAIDNLGISLNADPTTSISALTASQVLSYAAIPTANYGSSTSWSGFLPAESVIRGHQDGTSVGTVNTAFNQMTITKLNGPVNQPSFVGSVTSQTSGQERIERATVTAGSGSCGINYQSGGFTYFSNAATGHCSFKMAGFTSNPSCVCSSNQVSGGYFCQASVSSATDVTVKTIGHDGSEIEGVMNIICMGPR